MKTLLELLRDDAWNGVQGILDLVGAMVAVWFFARLLASRAYWWTYDQYYERVHWRLYGPHPGFDESATLTVKVVGAVKTRPDGSRVVERFE